MRNNFSYKCGLFGINIDMMTAELRDTGVKDHRRFGDLNVFHLKPIEAKVVSSKNKNDFLENFISKT